MECGEVAVRVAEFACPVEHVVREGGRRQRDTELVGCRSRETDVFVHERHVEPRLLGQVEQQGHAVVVVAELPRNPSLKVALREVAAMYTGTAP